MSEPSEDKSKTQDTAQKTDKDPVTETQAEEQKPETQSPAPVAKATPAATAVAEKPAPAASTEATTEKAAPAEPPFTVDDLLSCTARFTNKAWHLFYNNRQDMDFIRNTPLRATLEARTAAGAEELHKILTEAGVKEISRSDKVLSLTATFETIQKVIRLPQSYCLDVTRI